MQVNELESYSSSLTSMYENWLFALFVQESTSWCQRQEEEEKENSREMLHSVISWSRRGEPGEKSVWMLCAVRCCASVSQHSFNDIDDRLLFEIVFFFFFFHFSSLPESQIGDEKNALWFPYFVMSCLKMLPDSGQFEYLVPLVLIFSWWWSHQCSLS